MKPAVPVLVDHPSARRRYDPGVLLTAFGRYLPALLSSGADAARLTGPFSNVMDAADIKDPFIRNYMDLLCFLLSGLPAKGTISAEVVSRSGMVVLVVVVLGW
jgi:hypothetical protein